MVERREGGREWQYAEKNGDVLTAVDDIKFWLKKGDISKASSCLSECSTDVCEREDVLEAAKIGLARLFEGEYLNDRFGGEDAWDIHAIEGMLKLFPVLANDAAIREKATRALEKILSAHGTYPIGERFIACAHETSPVLQAKAGALLDGFLGNPNAWPLDGVFVLLVPHTEKRDAQSLKIIDEAIENRECTFTESALRIAAYYFRDKIDADAAIRIKAEALFLRHLEVSYALPDDGIAERIGITDAFFTARPEALNALARCVTRTLTGGWDGWGTPNLRKPEYVSDATWMSVQEIAMDSVIHAGNVVAYKQLKKVFSLSDAYYAKPHVKAFQEKNVNLPYSGWGQKGIDKKTLINKVDEIDTGDDNQSDDASSWQSYGSYGSPAGQKIKQLKNPGWWGERQTAWWEGPIEELSEAEKGIEAALRAANVVRAVELLRQFFAEKSLVEKFAQTLNDDVARSAVEGYEERLVEDRRFEELGEFLVLTDRELPLDPSKAEKELNGVLKDGMPIAASHLLDACRYAGIRVADDLVVRIEDEAKKEHARRDKRSDREIGRSRELPKEAHQLACVFYVDARIAQNIQLVMREVRESGLTLPFATTLRTRELENNLKEKLAGVSSMLQKYLVVAVNSELRHQDQLHDAKGDVTVGKNEDAKAFFRTATDEELLAFFHRARARFAQPGWREQFGGKKWAKIAEAAIALVQKPDDIPTIDHVFDLEHNTQAIFDKDSSLVEQDSYKMTALKSKDLLDVKTVALDATRAAGRRKDDSSDAIKVLDTKAAVIGNTRALVRALREQLPEDHKFFDKLDRVVANWVDDLRAIERIFVAYGKKFEYEKYI